MKAFLIAFGAMALASPVLAQTTGSPAPMATPPSDTSMPATSVPAQAAPAAAPSDPKTIIATEFPTYDKDGNGALARAEFDSWMTALKEKSGDTAMKPADRSAWLKTAFTTADKDKSKGVSLSELTDYLTAAG
jgi:hypothetical protein